MRTCRQLVAVRSRRGPWLVANRSPTSFNASHPLILIKKLVGDWSGTHRGLPQPRRDLSVTKSVAARFLNTFNNLSVTELVATRSPTSRRLATSPGLIGDLVATSAIGGNRQWRRGHKAVATHVWPRLKVFTMSFMHNEILCVVIKALQSLYVLLNCMYVPTLNKTYLLTGQPLSSFTCKLLMIKVETGLIFGHRVKGQGQIWHIVCYLLNHVGMIQATVFAIHFQTSHPCKLFMTRGATLHPCKLFMTRGATLLISGHRIKGQGQLWAPAKGCHALHCT